MDGSREYVYTLCVLAMHLMEMHGDRIEMTQDEIDRAKYRLDSDQSQTQLVTSSNNLARTVVCEIRSRDRRILVVEVDEPKTD